MERPVKRQRITLDSLGTDDEDELDCEPNELNQRRDPVYQLEQARARASNKLKSRFENIFARYEKDFTGVGDEIDLRTGEIVVNNGHLQSITGAQEFGEGDEDKDDNADPHFSGHGHPDHEIGDKALGNGSSGAVAQRNPWGVTGSSSDSPRPGTSIGGSSRLPSMMSTAHESFIPPGQPFGSLEYRHAQVVDPAWQAPELPRSAFMSPRFGSQAQQHRFGMGQTTKVIKRSLLEPRSQDGDEEDVLLGVPDNVFGEKESPLIKNKFPAVGSSPNNDPGLNEMIQDVIENIADTSPLAEQPRKGALGARSPAKPRMKPTRPDADINGKQNKKQTSEKRRTWIGKAKAVSSARTGEANPKHKKGRGRQIALTSPARAVKIRKTRQPKSHNEQQVVGPVVQSDLSSVDEDSFLDITGNTPVKPAGQMFYVEIKARKVAQPDSFALAQDGNGLRTVDRGHLGVDVLDQKLQPPLFALSDTEETAANPPNENCALEPATDYLAPKTMKPRIDGRASEGEELGLAFAREGAGSLPSRRQKRMSAPAEINGQALEESRPTVPQTQAKERFERNVVDPSYAFSDEENMLPRRKRNNRRNPEPASRASLAVKSVSRVGKKAKDVKLPQTTLERDASDQEIWNRAVRTSPEPIVEREAATHVTEVSETSQEQNSEQMVSDGPSLVPLSVPQRQTRRNRPEKSTVEQPKQQAAEDSEPRSLRSHYRNKPGDGVHGTSEFGLKSAPAVASIPAVSEDYMTLPEPPKTAESAPVPPSTPQPKFKSRSEKAGVSRSGLISLLSDDDDEEDEISFNLADFTPSGHHRILALRPHHHQTASASTGKKGRVASLFLGPASTSKVSKHSTPGLDNSERKRRRRSTNTLRGSVVKVRRESPRAPSPAASVVQTPGGTKRRCGEDGFRCERDFCFVCISI